MQDDRMVIRSYRLPLSFCVDQSCEGTGQNNYVASGNDTAQDLRSGFNSCMQMHIGRMKSLPGTGCLFGDPPEGRPIGTATAYMPKELRP